MSLANIVTSERIGILSPNIPQFDCFVYLTKLLLKFKTKKIITYRQAVKKAMEHICILQLWSLASALKCQTILYRSQWQLIEESHCTWEQTLEILLGVV